MKDFPPDGTRVTLLHNSDYFSEGIVGGETGTFTRNHPGNYTNASAGYMALDPAGYVTLDHPIHHKWGDTTGQYARPEDINFIIPIARTHRT